LPRGKLEKNRSKSDSENRAAPCRHRAVPRRAATARSETLLLFYVCGNFCRAVPSRTA
jgi:hypothetical protein